VSEQLVIFFRDFTIFFGIHLIVALSLNLEYGYAGVPNFGKVLAVAGGAFTVGFLPGRIIATLFGLGSGLDYIEDNSVIVTEVNSLLVENPAISMTLLFGTLIAAGCVGAVLGLIASYPAIRLREDYLSITLLAMGEAIQIIGYNFRPIIKGNIGVFVPDPLRWAGDQRYILMILIVLGIGLLVLYYLERVAHSPLGRMLKSIRENEDVAESLGKQVTRTRMKTIILASGIGAVAGALDAFIAGGVISTSYQRVIWTFWPWVMVVLGGPGNNLGVVLGTFVFITLRRVIDFYKHQFALFIPFSVVWLHSLLIGVILILILMFRPEGLIKEKSTSTINLGRFSQLPRSQDQQRTLKTVIRRMLRRIRAFFISAYSTDTDTS
jgi:branched-chain amino acid transport system permease protein